MAKGPTSTTSESMTSKAERVRAEQLKRLHLNLLVQGAAVEASSPSGTLPELRPVAGPHHLELSRVVGVGMQLSQIEATSYLLAGHTGGTSRRFWGSIGRRAHPYHSSHLLRTHATTLAERTYETVKAQAREVGISQKRNSTHDRQLLERLKELHWLESRHRDAIAQTATANSAQEWAIPSNQLFGKLRERNAPGRMFDDQTMPRHWREALNAFCSAGWTRVVFDSPPRVEAAALVYPLLRHELAKGISDLAVCHGLAKLDEATYHAVVDKADLITLERHGMQVGPSLFRQWVTTLSSGISIAAGLTHLSLAAPDVVEATLMAVVEDQGAASEIMRNVCSASIIDLQ